MAQRQGKKRPRPSDVVESEDQVRERARRDAFCHIQAEGCNLSRPVGQRANHRWTKEELARMGSVYEQAYRAGLAEAQGQGVHLTALHPTSAPDRGALEFYLLDHQRDRMKRCISWTEDRK